MCVRERQRETERDRERGRERERERERERDLCDVRFSSRRVHHSVVKEGTHGLDLHDK